MIGPVKVVGDGIGAADKASRIYVDLLLKELAFMTETRAGNTAATKVSELFLFSKIEMMFLFRHDKCPTFPCRFFSQHAGGLETVFFGGGTPSLTPPPLIEEVLVEVTTCVIRILGNIIVPLSAELTIPAVLLLYDTDGRIYVHFCLQS